MLTLATEKEKFNHLGVPGDAKRLAMASMPKGYKLKLSWKLDFNITKFQCHHLLVPHVEAIYRKLFALDPKIIADAGLDIWGGCYNYRPIRGTEKKKLPPFSTHSWAAAIDIDPERNGLWTKTQNANLSKLKFVKVHEIFQSHGFINIGKHIGRDWMHFEASYELISNPGKYI